MPHRSARQIFTDVRAATQRHAIAQNLYIAALCLVYLLHNIWAARTLFYYVAVPLALIGFDYSMLRSILRNPIFVLSGVFLLLLALTSLAAPDVNMRIIGEHLLHTTRILVFLAITAELIRKDETFLKTLMLFLSVAAAIAATVNIVAFYGSQQPGFASRLEGIPGISMYYNSNVVGALYAIACVGGVSVLTMPRLSRIEAGVVLISSLILLVAVVLTQSRGSILAAGIGLTVVALLAGNRRDYLMFLLGAIVLLAGLYLATPLPSLMVERGASLRPQVWLHHLQLAAQQPWLGHGLSFDTTLRLPDGSILSNAHNIILSALVRGGVAAAATLLGLIAVCLYQSWDAWRKSGALTPVALMATAIVATSFDYEITATSLGWPWILFWLPVGLCLAVASRLAASANIDRRNAAPIAH